ncbi:nitronate monooxygenase [Sphingomonas sp. CROZ-RG-20F-R02-07]|uniref:NAD(P)H-dependent flavin oxidoreductase n=1 Tax=Sphingomonas sp. CROZ-RG-20F-R02-07 TaxID=2914832 RepID=UPI001F5A6451|nr:nitronate monooxygenase [Sphingomonas sp. CROZ-RG-20F-R02-07]
MSEIRYGRPGLAAEMRSGLRVPVIAGPMFLVSGPDLIAATCRAGVIGALPALNARTSDIFDGWLTDLAASLPAHAAPYAVNLIVHRSNPRLEADLDITARHKAPVIIASIGNPAPVIDRVKGYGGVVLSDVATVRHARRAAESGADGLILLCAGAGGNTGWMSPFAFLTEVRAFFDGPVILAGALSRGEHIRAAELLGADMALLGTPFIAAEESLASTDYRQMLVDSNADDIVLTAEITGIPANMLRKSLDRTGFRPDEQHKGQKFDVVTETSTLRAWRDIWSAGHGVGDVRSIEPAASIVARLAVGYDRAAARPGLNARVA